METQLGEDAETVRETAQSDPLSGNPEDQRARSQGVLQTLG